MSNQVTLTNSKTNPAPLGLLGFALTTWLLSMANAGLFDANDGAIGIVLAMAFAYGGMAQFIAGLFEFKKDNTFGFVAFCSYGAFWLSFALFALFFHGKFNTLDVVVAWYLTVWGFVTLVLTVASLTTNKATVLLFVLLTITFFLLASGDFGYSAGKVVGGYFGMATALVAFYIAAAEVINGNFGRTVLPLGPCCCGKK